MMNKCIVLLWISLFLGIVACSDVPSTSSSNNTGSSTNKLDDIAPNNTLTLQAKSQRNESTELGLKTQRPLFGDTHVHTSYSLDAFIGGNRITPRDAYLFAQGYPVTIMGNTKQLTRPLDFAAITDHAEFLGEMHSAQYPTAKGYDHPILQELRGLDGYKEQINWFLQYVVKPMRSGNASRPEFFAGIDTIKSAWQLIIDAANEHNQPNTFTTLIGYEWTATKDQGNMHRVVLFRSDNVPEVPYSKLESDNPEDLWQWLDSQNQQGIQSFAITHNSNGSKGFMFRETDSYNQPIDATYATLRQQYEPLVEMQQVKGNSEVNQQFWPNDEFADFEISPSMQNFSKRTFAKENYVRYGISLGNMVQASIGVNPLKMGFIGGTDTHNSTPGDVAESSFTGGHANADANIIQRRQANVPQWLSVRESNPGSLSGVWATSNTREAIFDAMQAKETFATSGPRIQPRLFAGIDLPEVTTLPELITQGYKLGVSMGATLKQLTQSPYFYLAAVKDPDGANLDRIQIIKNSIDKDGNISEVIHNVVWSDERELTSDSILPALTSTVELTSASYTNQFGATVLMSRWQDPDFDPLLPASYYARVIEIPTPRWTTYDAVKHNLPLLEDVPHTIQERAWTSPIWYEPN
jgi:hypothetical protein